MSNLHHDPEWPRASAWLRGEFKPEILGRALTVLGVPLAKGSITPGRCDLAPDAIRNALARYSTYDFESEADVRTLDVYDLGDLPIASLTPEAAFPQIAGAVVGALSKEVAVLLGGDNSITRPGVHGLATQVGGLENVGVLTFDAHLDLRHLGDGQRNGNPIRALLEDGLPGANIIQLGIQSFVNSKTYAEVARDAGITVVPMDTLRSEGVARSTSHALEQLASRSTAIYVDMDIDVLDRAFSPGTPGSRPGGLMPWELKQAARLCGLHPKVKVMDLVELDPSQDIADATALAAALFLLSFAGGLSQR